MLHILLLILKIIGIIIAAVLGILVLLLCIVLFVPVKYEIKASFDGKISTAKAMGEVTWFFRLLRVSARYKNGRFAWRVKVAWKTILGSQKESNHSEQQIEEKEVELDEKEQKEVRTEIQKEPEKNHESVPEKPSEVQKEPEKMVEDLEKDEKPDQQESPGLQKRDQEKPPEPERKSRQKRLGFLEKLQNIHQKIKRSIHSISERIKALSEKKDKVMEMISDESHKKAFEKVKKEAFRLLKRLWPKQIKADIRYGFDDPCITGKILAVFSMLYPFIGEQVHVVPDFEQTVIEGKLHVKGKVRAVTFVRTAWNLIWCKAVRQTYRDIRNFEI